jgi:hypothetical protein
MKEPASQNVLTPHEGRKTEGLTPNRRKSIRYWYDFLGRPTDKIVKSSALQFTSFRLFVRTTQFPRPTDISLRQDRVQICIQGQRTFPLRRVLALSGLRAKTWGEEDPRLDGPTTFTCRIFNPSAHGRQEHLCHNASRVIRRTASFSNEQLDVTI